jgi:hypothetical protein
MPYIINKTNGEPLLTLEDGTLNDDYSVGLLGKNTIGYGEVQNENFIHLLENFAGISPPSGNILVGQVYYNSNTKQINVYDGTQWKAVGDSIVHPKDPTLPIANQGLGITSPSQGSFWLNSTTQQLFVYNTGWHLVGPDAVEGFGVTKSVSEIVIDTVGTSHPIIKIVVNDTVIAICSSTLFTIALSNAINGFSVIKPGITLSNLVDIKGNLDGNALTATKLQTPRNINGQPFDGTSDITVSASSSATLSRGQYIVGDNFNGSVPTTWSVDATSESNPSKIVVRDQSGDFSARTISANLIGNVTGNVSTLTGTSQFNEVVANKFEGNVTGSLTGLASSATRLETARTINGIAFDGTTGITIKAVTPNAIVPGQYIQGDAFDGEIGRSWNVLATPNNDAEKIVARDSQGNFVANTITSNIVGNVSGNINSAGVSNFNILNATQISGTLTGNASGNAGTATKLQFPRAINGVLFDGTTPITIKSSTTNFLNRGSYLTGNNFDGSAVVTWAVDATSLNIADKVVVRDNTGNFSANTITASLIGNVTGNVTGNVSGNVNGTTTGTHIGNVVGNVSGNVAGLATENVAKTGDTMIGDLSIVKPNAWLTLDSPSINDNGNFQGAGISIGESGYKGSASLHLTYTGDGYGHIGMGPVDNTSGIPEHRAMRLYYLNNNVDFYGTVSAPSVSATSLSGNGGSVTNLNASNLSSGTVGAARLSGTYNINITGSASGNVSKSGDSMSGFLTLHAQPTNALHAATKSYVDAASAYTITYGNTQYSTSGFTNRVGWWINEANYFDVFPPFGMSIGNLVAFIPSIAVIHYAGGVNGDDSMRCTWGWVFVGGWRIRVWVQNTEQRSTPAANWLAIWR